MRKSPALTPVLTQAAAQDSSGALAQLVQEKVQLDRVPAAANAAPQLRVEMDDDGPGIDDDLRRQVRTRGQRADESVPGSGLGLAIVTDLVTLYGDSLALSRSSLGSLKVLLLPAAAGCADGAGEGRLRKRWLTPRTAAGTVTPGFYNRCLASPSLWTYTMKRCTACPGHLFFSFPPMVLPPAR